jgi:transcriptional regulator with XRE-family HTH domain
MDTLIAPSCAAAIAGSSALASWDRAYQAGGSRHNRSMARSDQLGEFVRSRRARVSPELVGLDAGVRRRVPGLRREELAHLAHVSIDYVVRLEQGRIGRPSSDILEALARALLLDAAERRHLFRLAATSEPTPGGGDGTEVRPGLALLVRSVEPAPASTSVAVTSDASSPSARATCASSSRRAPTSKPSILEDATASARSSKRARRVRPGSLEQMQNPSGVLQVVASCAVSLSLPMT